jgi:hypothetical protein
MPRDAPLLNWAAARSLFSSGLEFLFLRSELFARSEAPLWKK